MEKISEKLSNLNKVSKCLLKYGLLVIVISFIIGNLMLRSADSVYLLNVAHEFVSANVYALCEVIIGAIMLDMFIIGEDKKE